MDEIEKGSEVKGERWRTKLRQAFERELDGKVYAAVHLGE
jgi:hypothetical protein